jgi:hypothetical protein
MLIRVGAMQARVLPMPDRKETVQAQCKLRLQKAIKNTKDHNDEKGSGKKLCTKFFKYG